MIETMSLVLKGPICQCHEQHLGWWPRDGYIVVHCLTCKSQSFVNANGITGTIFLKNNYPGGKKKSTVEGKKVKGFTVITGDKK